MSALEIIFLLILSLIPTTDADDEFKIEISSLMPSLLISFILFFFLKFSETFLSTEGQHPKRALHFVVLGSLTT